LSGGSLSPQLLLLSHVYERNLNPAHSRTNNRFFDLRFQFLGRLDWQLGLALLASVTDKIDQNRAPVCRSGGYFGHVRLYGCCAILSHP
jgi:hypothetical protein